LAKKNPALRKFPTAGFDFDPGKLSSSCSHTLCLALKVGKKGMDKGGKGTVGEDKVGEEEGQLNSITLILHCLTGE